MTTFALTYGFQLVSSAPSDTPVFGVSSAGLIMRAVSGAMTASVTSTRYLSFYDPVHNQTLYVQAFVTIAA